MSKKRFTRHARVRMGQRGIPDRMVEYALHHGRIQGDRRVLDRKEIQSLLDNLTAERALLIKLMDKGGIAVAANGDDVITAMNIEHGRNHV